MEQAWWDSASPGRGGQISQGCAEVSQPGGREEQDHPKGRGGYGGCTSQHDAALWMPSFLLSSRGWFLESAAHSQQTSPLFDVLLVLLLWCVKSFGFVLVIRKLAAETYCKLMRK